MNVVNIWDLERVNIKIKNSFLEKINQNIFSKFKNKRDAYNHICENKEIPWKTFKNILKKSYMKNFFVPLNIYVKIVETLNFSKETLQKNIISYKTAGGVNYIDKPILPIKISPIFDMIFAHHIGDGTVINPGRGRLPYFGYRQFNLFYRLQYVKLIEHIFGKIKFKEDYFYKSTRPYCPPILSTLFFKHYNLNIEDFLSEKARIPNRIFSKGKERILSVLFAFIIDEGHIDSTQITIKLKNKLLIEDLHKICIRLKYDSRITNSHKENNYLCLNILREGMKKLYNDYLLLKKKYSVINLGIKGKKIKKSFKIYGRDIYKKKGNQKIILEILKKEQLSVNQIADRLNMTRQGVRYHIHNLINKDKIRLIDNNKLNWIYGV